MQTIISTHSPHIVSNHPFEHIRYLATIKANYKLIKQTETYQNIIANNTNFIKQLDADSNYQLFKHLYQEGKNTYNKIKDSIDINSEEEFDSLQQLFKREKFIRELFSPTLKFADVLSFSNYLNEDTAYITMHKTKGTSIPSVIVVMEEYFWNEYDFSSLYKIESIPKNQRSMRSQKLIYVACSRAKHNLICIKVITPDETTEFLQQFPKAKLLNITIE